jgi:Domain of unknown function (DUF3883)
LLASSAKRLRYAHQAERIRLRRGRCNTCRHHSEARRHDSSNGVRKLVAGVGFELAGRIEHTSRDGEGYDILSFEESGRERLIEVKTTKYGRETPFFVSSNERAVSELHAYHLYRLFGFRVAPRLFTVSGMLQTTCWLSASTVLGHTTMKPNAAVNRRRRHISCSWRVSARAPAASNVRCSTYAPRVPWRFLRRRKVLLLCDVAVAWVYGLHRSTLHRHLVGTTNDLLSLPRCRAFDERNAPIERDSLIP